MCKNVNPQYTEGYESLPRKLTLPLKGQAPSLPKNENFLASP